MQKNDIQIINELESKISRLQRTLDSNNISGLMAKVTNIENKLNDSQIDNDILKILENKFEELQNQLTENAKKFLTFLEITIPALFIPIALTSSDSNSSLQEFIGKGYAKYIAFGLLFIIAYLGILTLYRIQLLKEQKKIAEKIDHITARTTGGLLDFIESTSWHWMVWTMIGLLIAFFLAEWILCGASNSNVKGGLWKLTQWLTSLSLFGITFIFWAGSEKKTCWIFLIPFVVSLLVFFIFRL